MVSLMRWSINLVKAKNNPSSHNLCHTDNRLFQVVFNITIIIVGNVLSNQSENLGQRLLVFILGKGTNPYVLPHYYGFF